MKEKIFYAILIILGLIFLLTGLFLVLDAKKSDTRKKETSAEKEDGEVVDQDQESLIIWKEKELDEMLQAFAKVIYTYDTRERKFYEGAENYTTAQAYQRLLPFEEEETEADMNTVAVLSALEESSCYYQLHSKTQADVIMESIFSLSASKNGNIVQYLKLSVERQEDQWKITDIIILDTIEQ